MAYRNPRDYKLRKAGLLGPADVDATPARTHANWLHDVYGMSYGQIARLAGVADGTMSRVLKAEKCRDWVRDAICGVRPVMGDTPRGARILAHGVQRRIEALTTLGFSYKFQSEFLNGSQCDDVKKYVGKQRGKYTHVAQLKLFDDMYKKLRYADPKDFGIPQSAITYVKRKAVERGAPGPGCWDDDKIDVASAIPEWTGACGTMTGWRIHKRDSIPFCEPCREARRVDQREERKKSD